MKFGKFEIEPMTLLAIVIVIVWGCVTIFAYK